MPTLIDARIANADDPWLPPVWQCRSFCAASVSGGGESAHAKFLVTDLDALVLDDDEEEVVSWDTGCATDQTFLDAGSTFSGISSECTSSAVSSSRYWHDAKENISIENEEDPQGFQMTCSASLGEPLEEIYARAKKAKYSNINELCLSR